MDPTSHPRSGNRYLLTLSLGALGVVYGDIGTSPLYAFRECFSSEHHIAPTPAAILGVLSLIFWSLVIVISFKYLAFVMRADNRGEGGILSLMSLIRVKKERSKRHLVLTALGLFGSALLYGDGMITPAISVLSAVEGIEIATPGMTRFVIPITVVVLIALFAVQKYGTAKVGAAFGPVMLVWFVVLGAIGVPHVVREPRVLLAVNPMYAVRFFMDHHLTGFFVLGAVFLVVTGGEALYADMGHFGAKPIRLAWFTFVFPALLLNYFGQGAFLLHTPAGVKNPFFLMAPSWALIPLVALATAATVIASQAVISGSFSLTRQAVQLGYLPRIRVRHTSEREIGQIYIPSVNWLLMLAAIALVVSFGASTNLAAAYGIAVTATMGITTILFAVVAYQRWGWSLGGVIMLTIPLLIIDLSFFGANVVKVSDGGWVPLVVGLLIFTLMTTWRRGRIILNERLAEQGLSTEAFMTELGGKRIHRVPGTAIFMSRGKQGVPTTMLHNIKHNKVVHQKVVFLTVEVEEKSHLAAEERFVLEELGNGVYRLQLHFGFMEDPNLPEFLSEFNEKGLSFNAMSTSYFLGRETLVPTPRRGMAIWREHVFAWMMRNSSSAAQFFCLPANQVIELGAQVEM